MRERIALVPGDIPAIPVASRPVVTLAGVIDVIASPLVPWDGSEPMVRVVRWGDDSKMLSPGDMPMALAALPARGSTVEMFDA